jgi:ABC-type lipopolysaccharide export system ATPase subunit
MLVATDSWKSYGDKVVVAGVSLDVAAGEIVGFPRPERGREIDDGRDALWPHAA